MDKALSSYIAGRMQSVVLEDRASLDIWRAKFKDGAQSLTFIPLDNLESYKGKRNREGRLLISHNAEGFDGFEGVAVNQLHFKEQFSHLRASVFYILFREALVFDTFENGMEFRKKMLQLNKRCPTLLLLDGNAPIETTGFITVGVRKPSPFHFGVTPLEEQDDYKSAFRIKQILAEYGKVLTDKEDFNKDELQPAENRYKNAEQSCDLSIAQTNAELEKVNSKIEQLTNTNRPRENQQQQQQDQHQQQHQEHEHEYEQQQEENLTSVPRRSFHLQTVEMTSPRQRTPATKKGSRQSRNFDETAPESPQARKRRK